MNACVLEAFPVDQRLSKDFFVGPGDGPGHTQTIQRALDACSAQRGGRVVLRAGQHGSGTIYLRSHVTLHLEKDAILLGSPNVAEYGTKAGNPGARIMMGIGTGLVFAEGAEDIAITGEGTIDGNGRSFWKKAENIPEWVEEKRTLGTWIPGFDCGSRERPRALVMLLDCRNVRMENVRIQNSPSWTVHLLACTHVTIRGITLRGAVNGSNTDGIDLDACSHVLVEDCDIATGDDAIALKNTNGWGLKRPSRHITVRRCRLCSTTHGFTIGTETQDDFEDIVLEDSEIGKSEEYRTLTGIGLSIVDGAAMRRVRISNVTIADAISPIQIRLANAGRGQVAPKPGIMEDITLEKISILRAHGNNMILGLPKHPLRRVALRDVKLEFTGLVDPQLLMAEVPHLDKEFPNTHAWRYLPAYGFFCRDIEGLELSNVTFSAPLEEKRPDLLLENVTMVKPRES